MQKQLFNKQVFSYYKVVQNWVKILNGFKFRVLPIIAIFATQKNYGITN